MAAGDVVAGIANVAAGARLTFQPAAGVEVKITHIASAGLNLGARFGLTNGTLFSDGAGLGTGMGTEGYRDSIENIFINHTIYLSITNANAAARDIGYSGIQTK